MIRIRFGLWLSGFLGVLYALLGIFIGPADVAAGIGVAAASVLLWGLVDWLEER